MQSGQTESVHAGAYSKVDVIIMEEYSIQVIDVIICQATLYC